MGTVERLHGKIVFVDTAPFIYHNAKLLRFRTIETDMFTPLTIRRFTGHENGAVYGAPDKKYDGRTHLDNLYVCGTDQDMVGIIGSIVSGITIANKYLLGG